MENSNFYKKNTEELINFFKSGISTDAGRIGIELEHILVDIKTGLACNYYGMRGVLWMLEQLSEWYPEKITHHSGDLLGLAAPGCTVTIEPAAQIEFSAGPFDSLEEAALSFEQFESRLALVAEKANAWVCTLGYNPVENAENLELIPKYRYQLMNDHFEKIGPWGKRMMRATSSTQISIDYTSEEDCMRKLRLANALTPLFSLLCDNSPIFQQEIRPHELMRTKIWLECDPERCGTVPGVMNQDFSFAKYAQYALGQIPILTPCGDEMCPEFTKTFAQVYSDRAMSKTEIEHSLSMIFADVRLKTYIEIRPADAMPLPYVLAYAALIKGLFYNEENLGKLDLMFAEVLESDILLAKLALMDSGFNATVYNEKASSLSMELVELAYNGLSAQEQNFLAPIRSIAKERQNLAMRYIDSN